MNKQIIKRIIINTQKRIFFLPLNEIVYVEASGSYTKFHHRDKSVTITAKSIKNYSDIVLDNPDFIRINRSFIINHTYLQVITKGKQALLLKFGNGVSIQMSCSRSNEWLKNFDSCIYSKF